MLISQTLESYLLVSAALLCIGIIGLLMRKNLVSLLISLELILNSASLNFMAFNKFSLVNKAQGQVFSIFIIALAAAEVCIALSLILLLYRKSSSVNVEEANSLKG